MGKNIVVVTGSGRRGGNSDLLADAFMKGALAAGHETVKFESAFDRIQGCVGCDTCWSRGKPCTFDDGFDRLFPLLEKADVIVLAGPVYWFTFSTFLKAAVDKLYSYYGHFSKKKLPIKESVLLMSAEDTDENVFSSSVKSYGSIADLCGWENKGEVLVAGVNKAGEIRNTDGLARAEKLGLGI